jgi:glutamate dehydrogenase/leucine dehydrogenase
MDLWNASPETLIETLQGAGLRRAYLVTDPETGQLKGSHPVLESLVQAVAADRRDYRAHEGCFFEIGQQSGHLLSAHVHRTRRGQAAGGVRFWGYDTLQAMVRDGLRLARGMGHKCALAGLWWGGGKGVVARRAGRDFRDPQLRTAVYQDYGRFMTGLRGCYVTAEDAGTSPLDIAEVFRSTRFLTCIPPESGGSGNPSRMTAAGVVCGMEAALDFLGMGPLADKKIVLQGTGSVGSEMIQLLLHHGVRQIVASEICAERRAAMLDGVNGAPVEIRSTRPGDEAIFAEPCDILSPCALGGVLGPKTIPSIRAKIVCGPANNQLLDEQRDALALKERGIVYVPDFLVNRMGIVSCSNEQYGCVNGDPMIQRHLGRSWRGGIYITAAKVLELARRPDVTPVSAAIRMADELARQSHPIWGRRAHQIVESLLADRWADS